MPKLSGAEAIIKRLRQYEVDTVFALPGGQLDHLFDAMYHEQDALKVYRSRHEQGVAYMAYGYAKSTGRVGVYSVVPGPGLLNSSAALATAWGNNAQVLCISGQIPSRAIGKGYGELHEIDDQLGILKRLTKWAERIDAPSLAPAAVDRAFQELKSGRPRPVGLEMAMDVMGEVAEVDLSGELASSGAFPLDQDSIDQAIELLEAAKRPLIIVGSGAIEAADAVNSIAQKLQAPVVSKRSGKGIVAADHYLAANAPVGHALWRDCDVVLAIGTRLKDQLTAWGTDEDVKIIRIDADPVELTRIGVADLSILGDTRVVLPLVDHGITKQNASREAELSKLKAEIDQEIHATVGPQMAFLKAIREALPRDGFFVDEVTQTGFVSWYGFPVYSPRQHVTAAEMGTLGFGFATALGVAIANPTKKTVQISGDGGFMFNVQELATAVEYNVDLVTVVFNDNAFANVQRQQDEWFDGRRLCSDLHNPDFVRMAESFGATGLRAETPEELRRTLEKAFATSGPVLIEVPVRERMPTPWKFIMMPQIRAKLAA